MTATRVIIVTLSSPSAARLAKSNALTGPVLFDEFDAGGFEDPANRRFIRGCKRSRTLSDFCTPDGVYPQGALPCEICGTPFQQRSRGPDLRTCK
jgi:hypothetical protein